MNADRWRIAVLQCHGFKDMMEMLDLDKLVEAGNTAGAIGPITDPTLYQRKGGDMEFDLAILKAAQTFVGAIKETVAREQERRDKRAGA